MSEPPATPEADDEAIGSRRPGPESTLEDVRAQLVAAAVDRLIAGGIGLSLDHIRLTDLIDDTGVSRSTAYRSLADDQLPPQAVVQRDALAQILQRDTRGRNLDLVSAAVAEELDRQRDNVESDNPADRARALRALIRVGCAASQAEVGQSTERAILMAAYGAARSTPEADWRHPYLVEGERKLATLFAELYSSLAAMLGYQLRPGMKIEHFSTAAAAYVEGLGLRHGVSEFIDGIERPTGPNGETEEWSAFGVGFEGMFHLWFEPVI